MATNDKQKIVEIMKKASDFAFLATNEGDQPRVRAVSPCVEDDMCIWIATMASSRKVQQIRKNPKVNLAFVVPPDGEQSATVIGEAEIVEDMEQKKRIWDLLSYDPSQFFSEGPESKEYCVLKINVKQIEWWEDWESGRKTYEP
jgi:pyridoxamine 5'-phosphate oxidase